eukprot:719441-Pelagomonas_calceolata.AAC.3
MQNERGVVTLNGGHCRIMVNQSVDAEKKRQLHSRKQSSVPLQQPHTRGTLFCAVVRETHVYRLKPVPRHSTKSPHRKHH